MQIIHKLVEYKVPIKDLILIYILYIRSVLEQSAVVWHSKLTCENKNDLERVQKTCLKIIFKGHYTNYEDTLKQANLKTLSERRRVLCLRFAKKCVKNETTKHMFPLKTDPTDVNTRFSEKFHVQHAYTERFKKSPIIYMQHLLNIDDRHS